MNLDKKILLIIVLQIIPLLLFPPAMLASGWAAILVMVVIYIGLGYFLVKGRIWALSMSIFLQGLNIVVRIMMLFPNSIRIGVMDWPYIITSLAAIILSGWFLLRLDRPDIRSLII
jgi:hypothetical protein